MKHFLNHAITLNLLFCLSYFTLATLGFEWGALTTNATLLWPPSGLALFGFLTFGRKILPGLLVGAIISSKIISLSNPSTNTLASLGIATITGCAAVLQAMLIAHLSRRYYLQDFRVSTTASIIFSLIVIAGCTISSTIGNITLWQTGAISLTSALQNFAVWWIGDVIGVLVIAPLLLWIHNKHFLYNSQANAFLIFCVGVGIVLLIVAAIGHNEHDIRQKNRAHQTESLQFSIQTPLDLMTRDLHSLHEYFGNNTPSREEFKKLSEPFLKQNLGVNSFSWIPVKSSNLDIDFSEGLRLVREKKSVFSWQGLNSDSIPESVLDDIKIHLAPVQRVVLSQQDDLHHSPKVPILNITSPVLTCVDNTKQRCSISAFIIAEIDLSALIEPAITRNQLSNLNVALRFNQNETYFWRWQNNQLTGFSDKNESLFKSSILTPGKSSTITLNENEWQLFINPDGVSTWFLPSFQQIKVLLVGLALVGLLSAYLQALYRHDQIITDNQSRLEQEIDTQTKALRLANETLTREIKNKELTQEQLKASEAHMRTLLDNLPYPVWFKSPEGAYLSFNKIVSDLFNQNEADTIGKYAGDYVDSDLEMLLSDYEKAVLESREAIKREVWMQIPKLNQRRLMDIIKVAVRDEAGIPIGILSIARDITEQHQLINELEKFKRFAEYASEGFSIMTLTAETLYMNHSMRKILSSEHTPEHNDFYKYFPSDIQPKWRDKIFPYLLLNGYWHGELAAVRADGSRFPTKETFFIIRDDKGTPIYLGEVMIDISEQKRAEESLQLAKETAEEATRAKSRFLANMSHEIRTPLNAVLGHSQLLIADKHLSPQQHERMNAILMAGQRLLHLINDILDLSKIEAGALHVREDYFDLHQELNDIVALMRTKATTKELTLNYTVQLPTPAIIKSDKQKIGQIILNLLGNAIKFTPAGEINLQVSHSDRGILIDVIDTGPGISAQELQLLFAAFKQGKAGEEFGGTGLGLVISKNIAEKLGGELRLDSEPGKGTHAHLRLPLALHFDQRLENAVGITQARLTEESHCSVLVVEDDKASRDVLVNLLRNIGCHVLEATTGKQGLAEALVSNPDIIFTDIRMPELSGSDMLRELRKKIAFDDMPVIAISASSLEHERTFYLSEGFHEFISKPYQFSDIYAALQKFTGVEFLQAQEPQLESIKDKRVLTANELEQLLTQLNQLKDSLNKGDMNTSKKLFAQQDVNLLGREVHQRIQQAMRQYDLVLAETFVDEVLAKINNELSSYKH